MARSSAKPFGRGDKIRAERGPGVRQLQRLGSARGVVDTRCWCDDRYTGADEIEVNLGSLDRPDQLTPTYECWTVFREAWLPPVPLQGRYDRDHDRDHGRDHDRALPSGAGA